MGKVEGKKASRRRQRRTSVRRKRIRSSPLIIALGNYAGIVQIIYHKVSLLGKAFASLFRGPHVFTHQSNLLHLLHLRRRYSWRHFQTEQTTGAGPVPGRRRPYPVPPPSSRPPLPG